MLPPLANTLFDPDATPCPAVARHLDFVDYAAEVPVHTHRKGQLIIALYGAVICRAENDIWIVPPDCAVWIPAGSPIAPKPPGMRISTIFLSSLELSRCRSDAVLWQFPV